MQQERARQEEARAVEEERAAEESRDLADMQKRGEAETREDGRQTTRSREAQEELTCHGCYLSVGLDFANVVTSIGRELNGSVQGRGST